MSPWLSDLYLRSQSDSRLLSLARDGHGRAFAVLSERYRAELLAGARRLTGTEPEDVVQQTLLNAFAALHRGAEVQHARGWLHAILRHTAIRARRPVTAPLPAADLGDGVGDGLVAHAQAREMLAAMDALPVRQREALIGSEIQGLSRSELAGALGISEGAVRQLVHRARAALRGAVTAVVPYPMARWFAGSGADVVAGGASATAGAGAVLAGSAAPGGSVSLAAAGGLLPKLGVIAAAGAIAVAGGAAGGASHRHGAARSPEARVPEAVASPSRGLTTARRPTAAPVRAAAAAPVIERSGATGTGASDRPGSEPAGSGRSGNLGHGRDGSDAGRSGDVGAHAGSGERSGGLPPQSGSESSSGSSGSSGSPGSSGGSDSSGSSGSSGGSGSSGSSGGSGGPQAVAADSGDGHDGGVTTTTSAPASSSNSQTTTVVTVSTETTATTTSETTGSGGGSTDGRSGGGPGSDS